MRSTDAPNWYSRRSARNIDIVDVDFGFTKNPFNSQHLPVTYSQLQPTPSIAAAVWILARRGRSSEQVIERVEDITLSSVRGADNGIKPGTEFYTCRCLSGA